MKAENRGFKASSRAINYQNLESSWAERTNETQEKAQCGNVQTNYAWCEKEKEREGYWHFVRNFICVTLIKAPLYGQPLPYEMVKVAMQCALRYINLLDVELVSSNKYYIAIPMNTMPKIENKTHSHNNIQCTGHSTLINFILSSNVQMLCCSYFHSHCHCCTHRHNASNLTSSTHSQNIPWLHIRRVWLKSLYSCQIHAQKHGLHDKRL